MARVAITPYLIDRITMQTADVVRKTKGPINTYPDTAPAGLGDELFSMILPADTEKAMRDAAPDWMLPLADGLSVALYGMSSIRRITLNTKCGSVVWAPYNSDHISINERSTIRNIPGVEELRINRNTVTIVPATDGSTIQQPLVKQFVDEVSAIYNKQQTIEEEINKAIVDMRTFLSQHKTLNKAAENFGPAIWEFVPKDIKEAHDRLPPKVANVPDSVAQVDVDYLVAAATAHRLQLNN